MRRVPKLAACVVTFGAMTTAALVVFALMVLGDSGDDAGGNGIPVVVAAEDIAAGTRISEETVKVVRVSEELVVPGAFRNTTPVLGQVTIVAVAEGEQVAFSNLSVSRGGMVCCPPGVRAVSLDIEPVTIEGKPVLIGDRVDILIEHNDGATTVVEDARVRAVSSVGAMPRDDAVEAGGQTSLTVAVDAERTPPLVEALSSPGKIRLSHAT